MGMLMNYRDRARCGHKIGPGGRDCSCCGDGPSGSSRRRARRATKRRERQIMLKEVFRDY